MDGWLQSVANDNLNLHQTLPSSHRRRLLLLCREREKKRVEKEEKKFLN